MQDANKPYTIVVGVDYSETCDLAVQRAFETASKRDNAELHLLNVMTFSAPGAHVPFLPPPSDPIFSLSEAVTRLEEYAQRQLAKHSGRAAAEKPPARIVPHVRCAVPAEEIAQLAVDLEADLVIVGTHGRRGLQRLLLGSVAESVVRLSPCPVLVVRPKQLVEPPRIQPPCAECVKTRQATAGATFWCEQHRERHGQRHTYRQGDRVSADGGMPLIFHG